MMRRDVSRNIAHTPSRYLPVMAAAVVASCGFFMPRAASAQSIEVLRPVANAIVRENVPIKVSPRDVPPDGYVSICQRLHQLTDKPLWLKPNAGLPIMSEGKITYPTTPDAFAEDVVKLVEAGAHWVGGCCGSSPEFVQAIARALKDVTKEAP